MSVKIASTPADADVYRDTEKLGTTAQPIKLPRGHDKVKLTIKKPGFTPRDLEIIPDADVNETLVLTPAKQTKDYGEFE